MRERIARHGALASTLIMLCVALIGCPRGEDDTPSGREEMGSGVEEMGADGGDQAGEVDLGEGDAGDLDAERDAERGDAGDMGPKPPRCPDAPPCARGYDHTRDCASCVAPKSRSCSSDEDCREQERCEERQRALSGGSVDVCILQESALALKACPGAQGCEDASGELLAAAVSRVVTPQGFETATPAGLDGAYMNFTPPVRDRERWNDCGYDGLCPEDEGYVEADEGELDGELQGIWIAGFSAGRPAQYCPEALIGCDRPECCVSKYAHDDLRVQIAVLRRGETTVAFAALDAVGYFHSYIDTIREEVAEQAGIDLLIMASSHSHESADTVGQWGPGDGIPVRPGRDARYMRSIHEQTVEGIKQAVSELRPARVEVAVIDTGVEGMAMGDSRPPYIFDDNVPVVRLIEAGEGGAPIATMLSVGNHAEVLWSGNPYLSADYFHFTREYVAEGLDEVRDEQGEVVKPALEGLGGVTVMFAGAVGGLINPGASTALDYADRPYREHGYAKADALGQRLAMHVLQAHERGDFEALEEAPLSFATKRFLTPITNTIFLLAGFVINLFEREMYNAVKESLITFEPGPPHVMSQVAVVRLGPLTFFTAPGEAFPELLVGGYPDRPSTQTPVIGDVLGERVPIGCDSNGLPPLIGGMGMFPCLVKPDQENPPDWSAAPGPPYAYDLIPGEYPFFIGLGMDFLGYMVPAYDYEPDDAPGAHYEETNGSSGQLAQDWLTNLNASIDALP